MKRSVKVLDTYARPKHTTQLEKPQSSRYFESFSQPSSNLHFRDSITETAGCISDLFSALVGLVVGGGTVDIEWRWYMNAVSFGMNRYELWLEYSSVASFDHMIHIVLIWHCEWAPRHALVLDLYITLHIVYVALGK